MDGGPLKSVARKLRDWTVGQALPLWTTVGFDRASGRFGEALTLEAKPLPELPTRLIVQARQIYSCSLAARRNWQAEAAALAESAYAAMVRDYHRPDGRLGWVFSTATGGAVVDARRDLYSHAFALLAISSYVQLTGRRDALALADATLVFIDERMRAAGSGGYVEQLPPAEGPRRQNPHMHLFEAFLSLWSSSGEARYLARAAEMFGLFSTRFFRPGAGYLGEYFNGALEPADNGAGEIVEPGHHFEWIWLLRWFERETGRSVQPYVDALFAHAERHGYDKAGLLVDEVLAGGAHRLPTHRVWPMTEAIKANVAEAALGRPGAAAKAAELANLLFDRFLAPVHKGGWMDRLDAEGRPAAVTMPASTLYHLVCAIDELDRFAQASPPPR